MTFLFSVQSEVLKTKRTSLLYVWVVTALVIPLFLLFGYGEEEFMKMFGADPWNRYYQEGMKALNILWMPMFIVLSNTLLPQLEYKNNTWKQVLAAPQPISQLFFAKFLVAQAFILSCYLMYNVLMAVSLWISYAYYPSLPLLDHSIDWLGLLTMNAISYTSMLAISAIQFWAGLRFHNFTVPIGIGLTGWFAGTLALFEFKWEGASLFPYTMPTYVAFTRHTSQIPFVLACSVGYALIVLGIAYVDFRVKGVKE